LPKTADLTGRISQTESNLNKFGQLEEGITKVTEETEMVAEEMKDILGSIRVSIDRLENRVNQVSTELQEVRDAEAQTRGIDGGDNIDEETKNQIKRLEESVADISESMGALKSLPEDVTGAVNNSRHALNNTQEVGERLEVIWDNLQSTLGYGARKTFRCDSCGSHGYVASQVTCSRCGITGWYGWYPTDQDLPAAMLGSNSTDPDELTETVVEPDDIDKTDALSDINGMAEMFGIADLTAEGTEVKHDTGRDKTPEISELEEMMRSAGVKDILDVPRLSEDTEETETGDSIQVTEDYNSDDAVTEPDNKSKPQKKKRAKKSDKQ
jgi:hypothetical protein